MKQTGREEEGKKGENKYILHPIGSTGQAAQMWNGT